MAVLTAAGVERSVDVQVTRLRRKIERDPREPVHLQTVRGVGYRLDRGLKCVCATIRREATTPGTF